MKQVHLGGAKAAGRTALVDDADYDLVSRYRWHAWECTRKGRIIGPYAAAGIWRDGKMKTLFMHALITGWRETDHRDHNGLNNQRSNLRDATHSQNACNQRPQAGRLSAYKGVTWDSRAQKWRARITVAGKLRCLGRFADEGDAAKAYDAAALAAWGEYAYLNFTGKGVA
jgi:hypothetical protein